VPAIITSADQRFNVRVVRRQKTRKNENGDIILCTSVEHFVWAKTDIVSQGRKNYRWNKQNYPVTSPVAYEIDSSIHDSFNYWAAWNRLP
jgi:hypothetical protein